MASMPEMRVGVTYFDSARDEMAARIFIRLASDLENLADHNEVFCVFMTAGRHVFAFEWLDKHPDRLFRPVGDDRFTGRIYKSWV